MSTILIGRKEEQKKLQNALLSNKAEMVAVIGRRRIGKTFLIESIYTKDTVFKLTGLQDGLLEEQLKIFHESINIMVGKTVKQPTSWLEAFFSLRTNLEPILKEDKKIVLFFDELPWLAASDDSFLRALGYFWNSWAVSQNLVLVICGSAASWMIDKVVNHKGGLHNRITKYIHLKPFTLAETDEYLKSKNIHYNYYHIVQMYMAMGGVPHYLEEIQAGQSATQNIDRICFSEGGLLKNEFSRLYPALFKNAHYHIDVIRTLAKKKQGMTLAEVIAKSKVPNGSTTAKVLEELQQSGFLSLYHSYVQKEKDKIYRLTDEYSLFYLQFMENKLNEGSGTWQKLSQTQAYKAWSGYAYESIWLKHVPQIKKALGILDTYTISASFFKKGTKTEKGVQIDLLLDRDDEVINLFEIKFYKKEFALTKDYTRKLQDKIRLFKAACKTHKQVFMVLITTFGLQNNQYHASLAGKVLTLEDLFL